jgi:hypothetical protein
VGANVAGGLRERLRGGGHRGAVAARPAGTRPSGFSVRVALRQRSRCTAAYSRRLARVTVTSWVANRDS